MLSLSVKTKTEHGDDGREKKRIKWTVAEIMLNKLIDIPEMLMTIIKFTYPAYHTKDQDFKKLNRLRKVDKKFNMLVDDIIWNMDSLPPMLLENITVDKLEKDDYLQRMTDWIGDIIKSKESIQGKALSQDTIEKMWQEKPISPAYELDVTEDIVSQTIDEHRSNLSKLRKIRPFKWCVNQIKQLVCPSSFRDDEMKYFTNLTLLNLDYNQIITNNGIKGLSNLTSLVLSENVSDNGIKGLTNLTLLNLGYNEDITNSGIKCLTKLTSLYLSLNKVIDDDGIKGLTNLTKLNLGFNNVIKDNGIKGLTNLIELDLNWNRKITDDGINGLINLTSLYLGYDEIITDNGIKSLTNLTELLLNDNITDYGIKGLIKLTSLYLEDNENITNEMIITLENRGVIVITE
jgi:hypothetical protein